jgi:hypothetical protein
MAKNFAGCRAGGGPNSRKLHDDGTSEHQNLTRISQIGMTIASLGSF